MIQSHRPVIQAGPSYGQASIAAVLPAAAGALGADFTTATGLNSRACAQALGLDQVAQLVVVLCDGLGLANLAERSGHAPFLRAQLGQARSLRTSFPATTAAALATFGTGTCPGLTGLLGYTQRNPATGGLANLVSWREQADPRRVTDPEAQKHAPDLPVAPERLQREPTVFERLIAADCSVASIGLARFAGSGLTRAVLRGGQFVGVPAQAVSVSAALEVLHRPRPPRLVYMYWGELDKVGHKHGWQSPQWAQALEQFDREFARLCAAAPPNCQVVLTADHGQIEVDQCQQLDVATDPVLAAGVSLVAGEPRALHLYCATEPGEIATRWRRVLAERLDGGEHAQVATRAEAIAAGWFGEVAAHVRPWIGEVLVVPPGRATVFDSRTQTRDSLALIGVHGGYSELEITIPLIVVG